MRTFVIGSLGLVGTELVRTLKRAGHQVGETDLPDGDVTRPESMAAAISGFRPEWIVNLAARTMVDDCEADPKGTFAANSLGAENVARLAARSGARLLHISTDYVFDGRKGSPYLEDDARNPLSVYGRAKSEGEDRARAALPADRLLIARAQTLYGRGKKSFPDTIRSLATTRREIPVVTDQVVQPTWSRELAGWLQWLMENGATGIYHLAAAGHCTWNEFARAIVEEWDLANVRITETTAAAFGRPATRPAYSVFDTRKFESVAPSNPRHWREQLHSYRTSQEAA